MTNFEKIKNMSLEELAVYIAELVDCNCCPADCRRRACDDAWVQFLKARWKND